MIYKNVVKITQKKMSITKFDHAQSKEVKYKRAIFITKKLKGINCLLLAIKKSV